MPTTWAFLCLFIRGTFSHRGQPPSWDYINATTRKQKKKSRQNIKSIISTHKQAVLGHFGQSTSSEPKINGPRKGAANLGESPTAATTLNSREAIKPTSAADLQILKKY